VRLFEHDAIGDPETLEHHRRLGEDRGGQFRPVAVPVRDSAIPVQAEVPEVDEQPSTMHHRSPPEK
jgi:hypothetical protein